MNTQKILVIDNDPEMVDILMAVIESYGLEGHPATSIQGGLEAVRVFKPDLVVMDLGYAQAEGLLFVNNLKYVLHPDDLMPPVMVMNGQNDQMLSHYAYDLGTRDFHQRTYNSETVKDLMTDYLPTEEAEEGGY